MEVKGLQHTRPSFIQGVQDALFSQEMDAYFTCALIQTN